MTKFLLVLTVGIGLLPCWRGLCPAQEYAVEAYSIEVLEGVSTGGEFQLSGAAGQAESSPMKGGEYEVTGGFWALITAIQMPGAPTLKAGMTMTGQVRISWPANFQQYQLEQLPNVGQGSWIGVTNPPAATGNEWEVLVEPSLGQTYFRLKKLP